MTKYCFKHTHTKKMFFQIKLGSVILENLLHNETKKVPFKYSKAYIGREKLSTAIQFFCMLGLSHKFFNGHYFITKDLTLLT